MRGRTTMKYHSIKAIVVATVVLLSLPAIGLCTDYQALTTKELSELRGTMYNAPQEERDAFRAEWRSRIVRMTPEEKQQYLGSGSGRGKGNRSGDGLGDGSGRGKGGGGIGANASGNGQGKGQNGSS